MKSFLKELKLYINARREKNVSEKYILEGVLVKIDNAIESGRISERDIKPKFNFDDRETK